ncbi:helix-turn-helix domain-containing protein [Brachybacterium tyrofermentans]|uniref:helix-turn-helix domain-containing protein n=1 Tax=Brachybacterium tyrofermentans TaxID=47848 RepID=UPI001868BBDC|nr:helix-turn-helix transcriptional regulator [Brachybacterium tyrofermentans]
MRSHGTRSKYSIDSCRCTDCTRANADYQRDYYRGGGSRTVDAAPIREHLLALRADGWTQAAIATHSGYGIWTIKHICQGRAQRVREATAVDLLSIPVRSAAA